MAKNIEPIFDLVGRFEEVKRMRSFLQTKQSEFVVVLGRRRVGKTYLIKKVYENEMAFYITGIEKFSKAKQIVNFVEARNKFFPQSINYITPKNWQQAFTQLKQLFGPPQKNKRVIFLDELPWLVGTSTEFTSVLDHFWNTWAIDNNVILVICGSATSWMITNIINNAGGLHNRATRKINVQPFNLAETETYFKAKNMLMPKQSIVELYMALGGIPYYLNEVKPNQTTVQNINYLCFGKNAPLYNEFASLYKALFKNYNDHILVIKALAKKWKGLVRQEIIDATKLSSGGGLTITLQELEDCNFIHKQPQINKKLRDPLYRLTDEYSLFYLAFIENHATISDYWIKKYNTQQAKIWNGYAFETLCIKHIDNIKTALGIAGIYTNECSFFKRANEDTKGCQIDILIDRADNVINICEMKYYNGKYQLTAADIKNLQQKQQVFETTTKTKKQIFYTLITLNGLQQNKYTPLINQHFTKDILFTKKPKNLLWL